MLARNGYGSPLPLALYANTAAAYVRPGAKPTAVKRGTALDTLATISCFNTKNRLKSSNVEKNKIKSGKVHHFER